MEFRGIEKREEGHFITRYNLTYQTAGGTEKVYEMISRDKNIADFAALHDRGPDAVVLIKPQFEAGKDKVGKKGVVRDRKVHEEVIRKVIGIAHEHFFATMGLDYSPIRGPEGNIEYLLWLRREPEGTDCSQQPFSVEDIVTAAHEELDR